MTPDALPARFQARIAIDPSTNCWVWQRGLTYKGYGLVHYNDRQRTSHRTVYELLVGPIPDGLQIDHLCRNRACCNPAHLEPVTARTNILRGEGVAAKEARQTTCKYGHALAQRGTRRECPTCKAEDATRRYMLRRTTTGPLRPYRLSDETVRRVRDLLATGMSQPAVAREAGIGVATVSRINRRTDRFAAPNA